MILSLSPQMEGLLLALVPALLVSIITSVITVRLSLRQFYSQNWWERKADAYTGIIEALSSMAQFLALYMDREIVGGTFRNDELEKLGKEFQDGRSAIERHAQKGAFLVSKEVSSELHTVRKELEQRYRDGPLLDELEAHAAAVQRAIESITELAQNDLQVARPSRWWRASG